MEEKLVEISEDDLLWIDERYNRLRKENKKLHSIIKEAIEFIYENAYDEERKNCIDDLWDEIPKLLDILKGSNKENV